MNNLGKKWLSVWLLLAISLGLNLYGIDWGLPNGDQDWANDSIAPIGPLVYAKRMLHHEVWYTKYPPLQYVILSALYAPYAAYLYLTGGIASPTDVYPFGLKDPQLSLMIFTLIARVTSALMGTGTVLVSYLAVRILYGHMAGLISGFLIATSYAVIYYSHNANIDVPQLFWLALALYSFVSLLKTYETKHYILLGLFSAFAIGTKNSAYALFPGLALPLLWFHIRHEQAAGEGRPWLSALFDRKLLYGFCTFVVALILVFHIPFNWEGFVKHVEFHLGRSVREPKVVRESASILQGNLMLMGKYLVYFVQSNGLPSFLLSAGGFLYCLVKFPEKSWPFIIPIVSYYFFFLRATGADHLRYALPVYLILTWQAGKFAADLIDQKRIPGFLSTTAIVLILAHSLLYGFSLDLLLSRDSRYAAEEWMEKNIPAHAGIVALRPDYSLPRFPAGARVKHIDTNRKGEIVGEVGLDGDDYLVIDMSLPARMYQRPKLYQSLREKGFCPVASFKTELPFFNGDVFHTVNPNVVILRRNGDPANCALPPGASDNHGLRESRFLTESR